MLTDRNRSTARHLSISQQAHLAPEIHPRAFLARTHQPARSAPIIQGFECNLAREPILYRFWRRRCARQYCRPLWLQVDVSPLPSTWTHPDCICPSQRRPANPARCLHHALRSAQSKIFIRTNVHTLLPTRLRVCEDSSDGYVQARMRRCSGARQDIGHVWTGDKRWARL
jgi:hypothetical protein